MNKYLRKLNSTCFDAAVGPAILLVGGFAVAAGLAVVCLALAFSPKENKHEQTPA